MSPTIVGMLHPGSMGVSVASACRGEVVWASGGRSPTTRARAGEAGLRDVGTLDALVEQADVIVSVVPPHAAVSVGRAVAEAGFEGLYVDANAVAPSTAEMVRGVVAGAGADFVDGGIIGPPARDPGTTRLYVSGPAAGKVASLFADSPLEAIVLPGDACAASALKMAYASWTKGSGALLMAIRAVADEAGVDDALLEEWARSQPGLGARADAVLRRAPRKAWRFVGEMEEIAATFAAAGLPDGFHRAAASVYRRVGPEGPETTPGEMIERLRP